jgi:phosphate starvation-inducible PhoH-like protein
MGVYDAKRAHAKDHLKTINVRVVVIDNHMGRSFIAKTQLSSTMRFVGHLAQMTPNQQRYADLIRHPDNKIVIGVGAAGSGKTYIPCTAGIEHLVNKKVSKILITRPAVSLDEQHGFLPGTLEDKMLPYMKPIYDCFLKYISMDTLRSHLKNETIEICPLSYIRGRTFESCFMIADETQNTTINQMRTLLTRIGEDCKVVITGDLSQSDLPIVPMNGLADLLNRCDKLFEVSDENCIDVVHFGESDVVRSAIVKKIIHMYSL